MANPTFFTVEGDFRAFVADSAGDGDYQPDNIAISAIVTFTPLLDGVVRATTASPRPISYIAAPITAVIDGADGRLKIRSAGESGNPDGYTFTPVRLLANTTYLELNPATPLWYRCSFTSVSFGGVRGSIAGFDFEAPNGDVTINLVDLTPGTGTIATGVTKLAPGGVRVDGEQIWFTFGGVDIPDPIPLSVFTGATGATGATGPRGFTGDTGPRGFTGDTGSAGPQGIQGEQGVQGYQGIQGSAGVSLDINGTVSTYGDLPSDPAAGDAYVVAADGTLYFFDGNAWPADGDGVPFVGPQGQQGIQGVQGVTGADSTVPGPAGDTGPANSLSIGTVERGDDAAATITGTAPDQTLNLTLPKGDTGPTGAKGDPGDPGGSYSERIGDGSATSFTITHSLGTRGVAVSVFDTSDWAEVECDVVASTINTITVSFASAPSFEGFLVAVVSGGTVGATGATGDTGATGATGSVLQSWRGEWDNFANYGVGDIVSLGGSTWILETTGGWTVGGAPPGYGWVLFTSVGATGATGATGAAGEVVGVAWFFGAGEPTVVVGSKPGDFYMDLTTGTVYMLGD